MKFLHLFGLMLGSAAAFGTRNAIASGTPVIQVDVYRNSVHIEIVGY